MNTNLVNSKTLNDIALLLYTQKGNETGIFAWIKEHKIISFIILCIIIFIWYKYRELQKNPNKKSWNDDLAQTQDLNNNVNNIFYNKEMEPKQENFMFEFNNTLNDDNEYQLSADNSMNEPYIRPTFNPNYPVKSQQSYVRYLPSEYPRQKGNKNILIDNSGKLIKNGGILPDQGISWMNYGFSPIIKPQNKGPDYYSDDLLL